MKQIVIGDRTYFLQYSTEAAFCNEFMESITELLGDIALAQSQHDIKGILRELSNIPQISVILFYAGLLKHHGNGKNADKSVPSKEAAKDLIIEYITEDNTKSFADLMAMCIDQMSEDGFFRMLGLDSLMGAPTEKNTSEPVKKEKRKKGKEKVLELTE